MANRSFKGFACWDESRIADVVRTDIASLEQSADAIFVAVHSDLPIQQASSDGLKRVTEERVMDVLLRESNENVLVAITGDTGTGKSHLIRWLKAHIEEGEDRKVIYVPRLKVGLRGVLELVLEELEEFAPERVAELRGNLAQAVDSLPAAQRRVRLLNEIALQLRFRSDDRGDPTRRVLLGDLLDPEAPDEGRTGGIFEILGLTTVEESLLRDGGPVDALVEEFFEGAISEDQAGGRAFQPEDFDVHIPNARQALTENAYRIFSLLRSQPSQRQAAADLIDEHVAAAVASVLGLKQGLTLGDVFADARKEMRRTGKELILLVEDMVRIGAEELYELFLTQPTDGQCLLRVAYAITPGPFDKALDTVGSRLSGQFTFNPAEVASQLDPGTEVQFMGRYLNAVRVGAARIRAAWDNTTEELRSQGREWVPNHCDVGDDGQPCPFLPMCRDDDHSYGFGSSGDDHYGLYPFNPHSLRVAVTAQKARDGTFIPREVIKTLIRDYLPSARIELDRGSHPSSSITGPFVAGINPAELRQTQEVLPEEALRNTVDGERLLNYRRFWMEQQALDPPPGAKEAFRLPATGEAQGETDATEEEPVGVGTDESVGTGSQQRPKELAEIASWQRGDDLSESLTRTLRRELLAMVEGRIDWASLAVAPHDKAGSTDLQDLLGINSFQIVGGGVRRPPGRSMSWELRAADEDSTRIFNALIWFREHHHWDFKNGAWVFPGDGPRSRLALTQFVDRCAGDVVKRLEESRRPRDNQSLLVSIQLLTLAGIAVDPRIVDADPITVAHDLLSGSAAAIDAAFGLGDLRAKAAETMRQIKPYVIDYTTVQLPDGSPQLIDVSRIVQVVSGTLSEPRLPKAEKGMNPLIRTAANALGTFDSSFGAEAQRLRGLVTSIPKELLEESPQEIAQAIKSTAYEAIQIDAFRPANEFARFVEACDLIDEVNPSAIGEYTRVSELHRHDAIRTVASLGPRRADIEGMNDAYELVRQLLETSLQQAHQRLEARGGVNLASKTEELAQSLEEVKEIVQSFAV